MAKYIDADKLVERLKVSPIFKDFNTDGYFIRDMVIDLVECQQTADVVEVIRCKDCVWWEAQMYGSTIGRCENPCNGLINEYSDDTDFCSYGKRRSDENNA